MALSNSTHALPFPADEIRAAFTENLSAAQSELGRLIIFFRGMERNSATLQQCQLQLMNILLHVRSLQWDSTRSENFDSPTQPTPPA